MIMSFIKAIPVIGKLFEKTGEIIDKAVPDKDKAAELKHDLEKFAMQLDYSALEQQASVIRTEAQGESFLQRNWRPIIMLMFGYIVFNNYILAPYVQCFYAQFPVFPIPEDLWSLLKLGIGGYVAGRTGEKIAREIRKTKNGK